MSRSKFKEPWMYYRKDKETKEPADTTEDHHLLLDGTANLDYADDELPQVKGLIELLTDYLGSKNT